MDSTKLMQVLDNPGDPLNQVAFLSNRISQLEKEISQHGDFGRSAVITMFKQIIISISDKISDPEFTAEILRNIQEQQILIRKYIRLVDSKNMRDAAGELMKIKKAGKALDALINGYLKPGV